MSWSFLDIATCVAIIGIILFKLFAASFEKPETRGKVVYAFATFENSSASSDTPGGNIQIELETRTPRGEVSLRKLTVGEINSSEDGLFTVGHSLVIRMPKIDASKKLEFLFFEVTGNLPKGTLFQVKIRQQTDPSDEIEIQEKFESLGLKEVFRQLVKQRDIIRQNDNLLEYLFRHVKGEGKVTSLERRELLQRNLQALSGRTIKEDSLSDAALSEKNTSEVRKKLSNSSLRTAQTAHLQEYLLNWALLNAISVLAEGAPHAALSKHEIEGVVAAARKENRYFPSGAAMYWQLRHYLESFTAVKQLPDNWWHQVLIPEESNETKWITAAPGPDSRNLRHEYDIDGPREELAQTIMKGLRNNTLISPTLKGRTPTATLFHGRLFYQTLLNLIVKRRLSLEIHSGSAKPVPYERVLKFEGGYSVGEVMHEVEVGDE